MITVECVGQLRESVVIDHINNIYKDNKKLGNFSEEFGSIALNVLKDEISTGDKFKIRVLDPKSNIIADGEFIFSFIDGGSLYYEG